MYKYIISSKERTSSSISSSSFTINSSIVFDKGWYKLEQFYLPNAKYNVDASNDIIYFTESGVQKTTTLKHGYYDSSNIASEMTTALNSVSSGYNVILDNTSMKLTITNTQPFGFLWGSNTINSANKILGFSQNDVDESTSITSTYPINVTGYLWYSLRINNNTSTYTPSGGQASYVIPNNKNNGEFIYFSDSDLQQHCYFATPSKSLNVMLLDDTDTVVNLQGADFFFVLEKTDITI